MKAWIDATSPAERLFGLDLVERALRALARLAPRPTEVFVSGGAATAARGLTVRHGAETGPLGPRLARYLAAAREPVLALDGRDVIDDRALAALGAGGAIRFPDGALVGLIEPEDSGLIAEANDLADALGRLEAAGRVRVLDTSALPSFVAHLRRDVPVWGYRLDNAAARRRCERTLFLANTKGSTDFLTKWVYPPLVWRLVLAASARRLHPNWVTVAGIVLAAATVPLCAAGYWLPGLAAAYAMSVLDSVDGKLARLTLTDSPLGNVLDHGLDIVHPPLWYAAWAWALSGAGANDAIVASAVVLCAAYVVDRLVLMVAKARFKRGLHSLTPLDARVRTVIARRNVNLVILTIGLLLGWGGAAFHAIAAWQVLTALWHGVRTALHMASPPDPLSAPRQAP
jgi:phosphatidylglycerophosphate synthase